MTDRLTTLMHDEVAGLEPPAPPTARIIAEGRTMRRRRTTGLVAGVVAVVLVATGVTVAALQGPDRESVQPADQTAYLEKGAWAIGDEVHVGDHVVTIPHASVLHYTSVGAVVGTSTSEFSLVTPDGRIEPLGLDVAGGPLPRDVATDPAAPYLAYIRAIDDTAGQLVIRDLGTGEETVVGGPTSADGVVSHLWGDVLFWFPREHGQLINWRTGVELPLTGESWTAAGLGPGSTVGFSHETESFVVNSRTDGTTLLSVPTPQPALYSTATLSLDGRYLAIAGQTAGFTVYDVDSGDELATFRDRVLSGYSWTPDGHLVGTSQPQAPAEVETCDPGTGSCTGTGIEAPRRITLVDAPMALATGS